MRHPGRCSRSRSCSRRRGIWATSSARTWSRSTCATCGRRSTARSASSRSRRCAASAIACAGTGARVSRAPDPAAAHRGLRGRPWSWCWRRRRCSSTCGCKADLDESVNAALAARVEASRCPARRPRARRARRRRASPRSWTPAASCSIARAGRRGAVRGRRRVWWSAACRASRARCGSVRSGAVVVGAVARGPRRGACGACRLLRRRGADRRAARVAARLRARGRRATADRGHAAARAQSRSTATTIACRCRRTRRDPPARR